MCVTAFLLCTIFDVSTTLILKIPSFQVTSPPLVEEMRQAEHLHVTAHYFYITSGRVREFRKDYAESASCIYETLPLSLSFWETLLNLGHTSFKDNAARGWPLFFARLVTAHLCCSRSESIFFFLSVTEWPSYQKFASPSISQTYIVTSSDLLINRKSFPESWSRCLGSLVLRHSIILVFITSFFVAVFSVMTILSNINTKYL